MLGDLAGALNRDGLDIGDSRISAMELAGLVREGYMERDEALRRLEISQSSELVTLVSEKLGVPLDSLPER